MSLALEQDSDAEDLAAMPMHEDKDVSARNRKQVQGMSSGRFVKVAFRGLEFSVKAREKGRGVVVPLEGGSLETVLRHLREQVHSDEQAIPSLACEDGDRARKRRRDVLDSREDIDGGRIRWLFAQCCYQVWFKDADGKLHQTTRGLRVARTDPMGQVLKGDVFKKAKALALHKARALWDENDRTSTERYGDIIPEESQ
jgi:hypothetical protein